MDILKSITSSSKNPMPDLKGPLGPKSAPGGRAGCPPMDHTSRFLTFLVCFACWKHLRQLMVAYITCLTTHSIIVDYYTFCKILKKHQCNNGITPLVTAMVACHSCYLSHNSWCDVTLFPAWLCQYVLGIFFM